MKADEKSFALWMLAQSPLIGARPRYYTGINERKRKLGILEKWCRKGWYEWGVSVDLGWLTPEGRRALSAAALPLSASNARTLRS